MQDLSFSLNYPVFAYQDWRFRIQVYTFENVYGIDPDRLAAESDDNRLSIRGRGLTWANGQEKAAGGVCVEAVSARNKQAAVFSIGAEHTVKMRSVKLRLEGLPACGIISLQEAPRVSVPEQGLSLRYPDGWRGCVHYSSNRAWYTSLRDMPRSCAALFIASLRLPVSAA